MNIENIIIILLVFTTFCLYYFVSFIRPSSNPKSTGRNVKYIFWTGGYDSTFCVCYYLFIKKQSVLPIYINGNIDNDEKYPLGSAKRKSSVQERETMKNLYSLINKKLSEFALAKHIKLFKPIIIDKNTIHLSQQVKKSMKQLYDLGYMRRPICQYAFLAQFSLQLKKKISVSVEYAPNKSKMFQTVFPYLTVNGNEVVEEEEEEEGEDKNNEKTIHFDNKQRTKYLQIFKYFDFPIIHFSKNNMLQMAKNHKFDDMLKHSWTCWYPVKNQYGNYEPCNKCIMCKQRNDEVPSIDSNFREFL